MRNLRTVAFYETPIEGDLPLTATAWDTSDDSLVCAFGPTPTRPVIELKRKIRSKIPGNQDGEGNSSKFCLITSWDAPCPLPDVECDEILLMHYFPDTATVCLVLAGGDLILVREEPEDGQDRIEIVGSVDVGIAAAAWAPDEELLAVVTRSDNLVLMSRDLEPVTETIMTAEDLQASKHVSVGWGKKETQFQGKRAKAMRDPTMPEHAEEGLPSPNEDGRTTVNWRGDGAYLAINAVVSAHRRVIRIYSREGVLDGVSEPVDGLEAALSWRPAGNLLAGIKRSKQGDQAKLEVIFFERNGLRHGEFQLRLKPSEIDTVGRQMALSWNVDSTILAVSFVGVVQYWTMSNYHYYLKQEVEMTKDLAKRSSDVVWHPEKPSKCTISNGASILDLEYLFHVSRGSTRKPHDYGIVAVIDGTILKLTPLKHAGVPPPMAFCDMEADSNIIDTAISSNGQRIAMLTTTSVEICDWEMQETHSMTKTDTRHTTKLRKQSVVWQDLEVSTVASLRPSQIVFQGNNDLFILFPCQKASVATCLHLVLQDGVAPLLSTKRLDTPDSAQNLLTNCDQSAVWMQTTDSAIAIKNGDLSSAAVDLPGNQINSTMFQVSPNLSQDSFNDAAFHRISLTTKGSLMADQRTLARDCTSFILTDQHLICTTSQHLLKFVHLTSPDKMEVPGDTPEVDERCRSIERGAKIVTVIPSAYAAVLQMPRGNLETIYPRVLVLNGIRESLRNLEFRRAFLACQNHQVDMNILHDYLPDLFMANIKAFIDELKKPSRVDEFLSKLKVEDVTQTLYKDTLNTSAEGNLPVVNGPTHNTTYMSSKTSPDKVNRICNAFISILRGRPGKFLQCIVTAHVCKRPPDLTAALTLVSSLRQTSSEEADFAISHLCFLTDTNRLYDAALALYDLELTLLVAQNAQRDPREYMPFLQNLQSLPQLRRQYQVDNHLRNYAKALTSLHALEADDEVLAYTTKHGLYTNAMDLYKYQPTQLATITNLYASHLASQSQHSAAAILYESLGSYVEAYPLYALAHQWRESLTCAALVPVSSDKIHDLALSLATSTADINRDYRSAATIHIDYLHDPSTATKLLCKGSYFADATRVLSLHNLSSEIPTTIDPALGDKFSEILELVADCKSQLTAQVPRIQELRVKKAEDPLAFFGGDAAAAADGVEIPDNISLAPTDATTAGGQSLFTRYGGSQGSSKFAGTVASNISRKTSKTKRREERKRARGKKGSVYEEEYLVASVGRLIERVNGVHDEVGRLVSGLLRRGMRERASKVGEVMREIVAACQKAREDVWEVELLAETAENGAGIGVSVNGDGIEGPGEVRLRPGGGDGVFWDSQQDNSAKKAVPVISEWKGNGLLTS